MDSAALWTTKRCPQGLENADVSHTDHSPYYYTNKMEEAEKTEQAQKRWSRCSGVVVADAQV